jgi:hypothetical protein
MPTIPTILSTLHSSPPSHALAHLAYLDWITLTTHTFEADGWYCAQTLQFSASTDAWAVAPLFAVCVAESEEGARAGCARRLVACVGELSLCWGDGKEAEVEAEADWG